MEQNEDKQSINADGRSINVKSLNKKLETFMGDVGEKFDKLSGLLTEIVNKPATPVAPATPSFSPHLSTLPQDTTLNVNPTFAPIVESVESYDNPKPVKLDREIPLQPELQVIFEKYFDQEDGFKAVFNDTKSGVKINIPRHLSRASEAHWKFYKEDVSFKVLDRNNLEGSMEKFCQLVCQYLKYQKKIKVMI